MEKNKIILFFCDYDVTHSNVGKELGLDRKGEIQTFINSLKDLKIREDADQVVLTFVSDNAEFKNNAESFVIEFGEMIKEKGIILGNHFDHQSIFSCDGVSSTNDKSFSSRASSEIIGDKILSYIQEFSKKNIITSARIARNSIGDSTLLTDYLKDNNISFMHYTFNNLNKSLPNNTKTTYTKNRMYANWMDLTSLNALLSEELFRIKKQELDVANKEQTKQQIIVYKK